MGRCENLAAPMKESDRVVTRHRETFEIGTSRTRSRRDFALLLRRIEAMAIAATEAHWARIPPDLAERLGPRVGRVADALYTLLEASDSLQMNRVIGLGHRGRASEAGVDEIIARYRAAGIARFSVLMSPGPQAKPIERWLLRRGFTRHSGHALLVRDLRVVLPRTTAAVKVIRATPADRATIVRILAASFGMPASRRSWSLAAAASRETEHFLALLGATPIGVGALRVAGELAWLGAGATLTRWRRRGAHRAVILARLRRPRALGCRTAWVETGIPERGRPGSSRRNLLRLGFEEACLKPAFVWRVR